MITKLSQLSFRTCRITFAGLNAYKHLGGRFKNFPQVSVMCISQSLKEDDGANHHIKIHVARSLLTEPREITAPKCVISPPPTSRSKC